MDKTKVFEAAGKFAAKGQFDKAAKEYQRILEEDPKDVRALQKLAEIFQKANKPKEATDLMLRVAEGYTEQGFFLKAVAVYKQVLKVGPERIEVNQRLAQLYQQLGLIGDATQQWQLVANYYDKAGNIKESLAAVRKMVELDPDNVASQVKLGEMYARENMVKEATAELRKAAAYLRRNSRLDDYIRVLDRVSQLVPEDVGVARELAKHHLSQNDTKRALAKLQVCFRADPKDVDTLQMLAQAFSSLGQDAKTISVYRELASIYNIRGDADSEKATLETLLTIAPNDEEATARLREMAGPRTRSPARERTAPPPQARSVVIAPPPPPPRAAVITPAPPQARPVAPPPPPPPPSAMGALTSRGHDPRLPPAIAKILTETDVYLKYGLLPKAAEHIRKALIDDPNCIPAHEKLLNIVDRQNKVDEVLHQLERLVELSREAGDSERDRAFTQELAQRNPQHPLVVAAAAAAELPSVDEEELVIDPDSSWAPDPNQELIDVSPSVPGIRSDGLLNEDPLADDDDVVMDPEPLSMAPPSIRRSVPLSAPPPPSPPSRTGTTLSFHMPQEESEASPWREPDLVDAPDDSADLAMQAAFENSLPPPQPFHATHSRVVAPQVDETEFAAGSADEPIDHTDAFAAEFDTASEDEPALETESASEADSSAEEASAEADFGEAHAEEAPADFGEAQVEEAPAEADFGEAQATDEAPAEAEFGETDEHARPEEGVTDEHLTANAFSEEFAEAEFLFSQGLVDDARHALEEILERAPGHPGATALLEQIVGETELPPAPSESIPPGPVSHINLTQELADELEGQDLGEPVQPPIANPHSVTDVLSEFKKALSTTVSAEDSQTHYDLGIAYREMGLLDEAIHEFEVASQSRGRRHVLDCLTMLGMCHLERNQPREAVEYFSQALHAPGLTLEASKEGHFQLGVCHELLGERREAMEHYARVYKADADYRDVRSRLGRLTRLAKADRATAGQPISRPAEAPAAEAPRAGRGKIGYI